MNAQHPRMMENTMDTQNAPLPLPVVVAIHVPQAELRAPRVTADVVIGPVVAKFTAQRKRGGGLEVKPPVTRDGEAAFKVAPALHANIAEVITSAVKADPAAARYLAALPMQPPSAVTGRR